MQSRQKFKGIFVFCVSVKMGINLVELSDWRENYLDGALNHKTKEKKK